MSWSRDDMRAALAFGVELAGFVLLLGASAAPYKVLGGILIVAGAVLFAGPSIGEAIARERTRNSGRNE